MKNSVFKDKDKVAKFLDSAREEFKNDRGNNKFYELLSSLNELLEIERDSNPTREKSPHRIFYEWVGICLGIYGDYGHPFQSRDESFHYTRDETLEEFSRTEEIFAEIRKQLVARKPKNLEGLLLQLNTILDILRNKISS